MVPLTGKIQTPSNMPKSKDQKILELEQKIRLLEKQKAFLAKQAEDSNKKAIFFDMMIDIAEKEFNIPIPKKLLTRTIDRFTRENKVSKTSTCGLLGVSRPGLLSLCLVKAKKPDKSNRSGKHGSSHPPRYAAHRL